MGVSPTELSDAIPDQAPVTVKAVAGRSPSRIALERLRHDKVAVVCAGIVATLVVLALFAPLICKAWGIYWDASDPRSLDVGTNIDFDQLPLIGPPNHGFVWSHPLGISPGTAQDNLAYLLYGLRTSLFIATAATVISTIIGVVAGLLAGFSRGWLDRVLTFCIDLFLSFPFILGALSMAPIITSHFSTNLDALAKAQVIALISVLVVFGWMGLARLIRGQVLSLREREFIQAAQVMGVPTRRILFKELLPNMVAPIVVATSLSIPAYVAAEALLSYLGLGLTGYPSLGQMIASAQNYFEAYPLYLWAPVATLTLLVISLNLLGDAIRDAFDPKTRR
jgi:ABC-type dipeptide/oligopeptide/nickel transport system permease subunit